MFTAEQAMKQASKTSHQYAVEALDSLCRLLDLDQHKDKEWRTKIAPFAPVWAAMIAASTSDFASAMEHCVDK